jgi:hypothetical protein
MLMVTSGCQWYASEESTDQAETPSQTAPGDSFQITDRFVPTLWGDASQISISPAYSGSERPGDNDGKCIRISYLPGDKHWGAVYWQTPREAGIRKPVEIPIATKLHFWAKGESGGEQLDFRALGEPARDLLSKHDRFELTLQWKQFELPLKEVPSEGVTALFGIRWQSTGGENPNGLIFYLDDLRCE